MEVVEKIKKLKRNQSMVYHVGNLVREAAYFPEVKAVQEFVVENLCDTGAYGKLTPRLKPQFATVQKKVKGSNAFEYHIKRI